MANDTTDALYFILFLYRRLLCFMEIYDRLIRLEIVSITLSSLTTCLKLLEMF